MERSEKLCQSSEDSSSLDGESEDRGVFRKGVGECSKVNGPFDPVGGDVLEDGLVVNNSCRLFMKDVATSPILSGTCNSPREGTPSIFIQSLEAGDGVRFSANKDQTAYRSTDSNEQDLCNMLEKMKEINTEQGKEALQGIDLCIDLRELVSKNSSHTSGGSVSPSCESGSIETVVAETQVTERGGEITAGKKRGGGITRTHPMKTRRFSLKPNSAIKKVKWNIENEIAKVIEEGVARRIEHISRRQKFLNEDCRTDTEDNSSLSWKVDEEVTKVIETGVKLGFDFNGNELEISQVLATMEMEDEARFKP
jgi:hypothetical protein